MKRWEETECMRARVCGEEDYIGFLLAAQEAFSCVEASRTSPHCFSSVSHDAYTRLLTRRLLDTGALWDEAQRVVGQALQQRGLLVLDDTTLDKPYARHMALVTRHWSGKHRRVVKGINLLSLVWTPGYTAEQYQHKLAHKEAKGQGKVASNKTPPVPMPAVVPLDLAVYDTQAKPDNKRLTKNDLLRALLHQAKERGLCPEYVAFDSWYSGVETLKVVRALEWRFLTRLAPNRRVNPAQSGLVEVRSVTVPAEGQEVWLKGFGLVRLFQKTRSDGKGGRTVEHWISNDLALTREKWQQIALSCWVIECYHRGLKSCCGIERAQVRSACGQKNHLLLALRAFVRLEHTRLQSGISWYQAKRQLVRHAIFQARLGSRYALIPTA